MNVLEVAPDTDVAPVNDAVVFLYHWYPEIAPELATADTDKLAAEELRHKFCVVEEGCELIVISEQASTKIYNFLVV